MKDDSKKSAERGFDRKPLDLSACALEPIHIPGAIQAYGVLIATAPDSKVISHISGNFQHSAGLEGAAALGQDLDRLLGQEAYAAIEATLSGEHSVVANLLSVQLAMPREPHRTAVVHRYLGRTIVELEPALAQNAYALALSRMQTIIASLRSCETVGQLCEEAARQFRLLTGYDRVMVYRFDPGGDGRVITEDRRADLISFLDLRYPASDIPEQARRLYLLQRVRYIEDVQEPSVPILAAPGVSVTTNLDMTYCGCRAVSPVHLEYLDNMGVRATLTLSLVQDDMLWGMLVCHHLTPKQLSVELRAFCDVVSQLMSVLLRKVSAAEELAAQMSARHEIARIREDIHAAGSVTGGLLRRPEVLLGLMGAGGVYLHCDGKTSVIGETPAPDDIASLLAVLGSRVAGSIFSAADAGMPGGAAAACPSVASGIMIMPISSKPGGQLVWFRPEVVRTVVWAGDPHKPVDIDQTERISPRKSFQAWTELQNGQSLPWTEANLYAAQELNRVITDALLRHAEAQLAQMSSFDPLTGLANRRMIDAEIARWRSGDGAQLAALLLLDLDRFKAINDSLGHNAGDDVLLQFSERLRARAPTGSTAGRLGGDEFVIFWPGALPPAAEALAQALVGDFNQPFLLQGQQHYAAASVGLSYAMANDTHDLSREADIAMYAAKRQGGGKVVVFEPGLHYAAVRTMRIEQDLFRAFENDEFEIHYQPLVRLLDRQISGFEALLRWRHPERNWMSPADFIPVAEDTGLIIRIGAWVLTGAIREAKAWSSAYPALTLSINASARQLTDGLLSTLLVQTAAREGFSPESICIEVTESALMDARAVQELQKLRALNFSVAVDDFGTGYSSLAYLGALPVDTVKIDRNFVAGLGSNTKNDRLFRAIVDLAHTLDLHTVAEGCETQSEWDVIAASGCEKVQGWLVAKAMPASAVPGFLASYRAAG
jgi:diguanylate cyclase (GGDEF)-like protein